MIRATVENGTLVLKQPLPPDWSDGRELIVQEAEPLDGEDFEEWRREVEEAIAEIPDDPDDRRVIQQILDEADAIAKDHVRRQMGLKE